jgi:opacity protein-like surface antigen
MKTLAITAATLAALAVPALAGGPTVVMDDPIPDAAPAPVAAHDWSGPYVGLSYGRTSADIEFSTTGAFDFNNGNIAGIYGGYLMQRGSFVYGGELAYGRINDAFIPGFGDDDVIEHALDLKARVGLAANRALFYGVIGYSQFNYFEPTGVDMDLDGLALGLGAEVAVTERFTMGLEYLSREGSGDDSLGSGITGDANLDTFSLRVGLSF